MTRLNTLISKHQATAATLEDEAFNLQRSVVCELKELEQKAARLERDIEGAAARKKGALDGVLDAERQIMLWERKLQLEKEMQDILDPSVGQVCAVPCVKRRSHTRAHDVVALTQTTHMCLVRAHVARGGVHTGGAVRTRAIGSKRSRVVCACRTSSGR